MIIFAAFRADASDFSDPYSASSRWLNIGCVALLFVLFGCWRLYRLVFFPPLAFARVNVVSVDSSGCRAEGWVEGKQGDTIVSLTGYSRGGSRSVRGYAVVHPDATTNELRRTASTPQGDCSVVRYHLLVNGQETDSKDVEQ